MHFCLLWVSSLVGSFLAAIKTSLAFRLAFEINLLIAKRGCFKLFLIGEPSS